MLKSLKLNISKLNLLKDHLVFLSQTSSISTNSSNDGNSLVLLNYLINRSLTSNANKNQTGSKLTNKIQTTSSAAQCEFGFLFDIDGVLVRGKTLLPHTKECIRLLTDRDGNFKIPTVFLTNAGNELRSSKSAKLSQLLGVQVKPDQVVMSHSPLRLLKNFHNKRCLISGQGPVVDIAKNLGFTSIITLDELRQFHPHLDVVDHKRRNFAPCVLGRYSLPIEAIILFGESIRWETSLQLLLDVIKCNGKLDKAPMKFPEVNLPILACNTDMVWMAEASMPRFGHGTFLHCLESVYEKLSGRELNYTAIVGKPSEITYYYAESMLKKHAESIGINVPLRRIYAVGDNLDTDIYGANVYNQILENNKRLRHKKARSLNGQIEEEKISDLDEENFNSEAESITSILVRTGVFQGDVNDLNNHSVDMSLAHKDMIVDLGLIKPRLVKDNVLEAVKSVFQMENFKNF